MITLVTGGSKCGKSSYAESVLDDFTGKKIYLATMMPYGSEAEAAINRHREMRKNKGFETIEIYTDIGKPDIPENSCVLLECIGNLLANEMFENNETKPSEKIIKGIKTIAEKVSELVVVTNEVSSDGINYTAETQIYISEISRINAMISEISDNVIECVYGIPVALKGNLIC